jgi:LPXTG-site transpeptidase (sortase) family protein
MSRLAMGAASTILGACIGVGVLVAINRPIEPVELMTPVAAAAPSEAPSPSAAPTEQASTPSAGQLAEPVRVVIPAIDVDVDLVGLGLNPDSSMEVPDFGDAGWYTPGPVPGEAGPAVIAAHVDSVAGPDVFYRLDQLRSGDEVTVEHADGTSTTFVVRRREQQLKEELPVDRIWNDTSKPVLRLITCGGDFDEEQRSYRSNVIVFAAARST